MKYVDMHVHEMENFLILIHTLSRIRQELIDCRWNRICPMDIFDRIQGFALVSDSLCLAFANISEHSVHHPYSYITRIENQLHDQEFPPMN